MNYRRIPRFRRYPYINPQPEMVQEDTVDMGSVGSEPEKDEIKKIPMPNENPTPESSKHVRANKPMLFDNLIKNIHVDDLILLGLIFILLQENVEDEFLIIVLIYLLIVGKDQ